MAEQGSKQPPSVTIEFSGADGMTFTIRNVGMTTAQWALAAQLVGTIAQSMLAQTLAASMPAQLIRAMPSDLGQLARMRG